MSSYALDPPIRQKVDYVFMFTYDDKLMYAQFAINTTTPRDIFENVVAMAERHKPFFIYEPYWFIIAEKEYIARCKEKSRIISDELFDVVNQ